MECESVRCLLLAYADFVFFFNQMSGSRMKIAGRFRPCMHMGCFDLETFVDMQQRSRKVSNHL